MSDGIVQRLAEHPGVVLGEFSWEECAARERADRQIADAL